MYLRGLYEAGHTPYNVTIQSPLGWPYALQCDRTISFKETIHLTILSYNFL